MNIVTSCFAFISTNIDDIFILTLFYGSKRFTSVHIVVGQYLGIGALVAISFAGSFIGSFFDARFVGFFGLFPIYLAIKQILDLRKANDEGDGEIADEKNLSILAIAGVTIANGGDNIGVYIPLLTTMSQIEKATLILVFFVMTYVWCAAARYLAGHPMIAKRLDKYGHIVMPVVLFSLGIFIILESNSISLFWR